MASNQVVTYEEVKAYQANNGISTYEVGSGGYPTGGIYVEWTTDGGFTNRGWDNGAGSGSPVAGMTVEDIHNAIDNNNGTLNDIFEKWVGNVGYEERYKWILNSVIDSCRREVV